MYEANLHELQFWDNLNKLNQLLGEHFYTETVLSLSYSSVILYINTEFLLAVVPCICDNRGRCMTNTSEETVLVFPQLQN